MSNINGLSFTNINYTYDSFLASKPWHNTPYMLAEHTVRNIMGIGILPDSENEECKKFINNWLEYDKVYIKLKKLQLKRSLYGSFIMFLLPYRDKDNDISFSLAYAPLLYNGRVGLVNEKENMATIYMQLDDRDDGSYSKIVITRDSIIREDFVPVKKDEIQTMGDVGKTINVSVDKIIFNQDKEKVIFPVYLLYNKMPSWIFSNNNSVTAMIPDVFAVSNLVYDLQDSFRQQRKERITNKTKVFINANDTVLEKLKASGIDPEEQDVFLRVPAYNDNEYSQAQSAGATSIQGDPKLLVYTEEQEQILGKIFIATGWKYASYTNQNYVNKSQSDKLDDLNLESAKEHQQLYKLGLCKMLDCLLALIKPEIPSVLNGDDRPYSFVFLSAQANNTHNENEIVDMRLANGTMSRIEAKALLDRITLKEAEKQIAEIDKEMQASQELLGNSLENDNQGDTENASTQ